MHVSFLSNLFQNTLISKWLDAEGRGWSHFLRLFQEIPFRINCLKIDSQGASQHSIQGCRVFCEMGSTTAAAAAAAVGGSSKAIRLLYATAAATALAAAHKTTFAAAYM